MSYRIQDEPRPGALGQISVNPMWPLLSIMFVGVWLCWPWFVVNAFAVGSPTRRREALVALGGFVGVVLLLLLIGLLPLSEVPVGYRYAELMIIVWKLGVSYYLYTLQGRSFGLYEYFGGKVRNGAIGVFAGFLLSPAVLSILPDGFWQTLLR